MDIGRGQGATNRRDFLKTAAVSAAAIGIARMAPAQAQGANERIRFGVIGCGGMGTGHLSSLVGRSTQDNIEVVAASDVYQRRVTRALGF